MISSTPIKHFFEDIERSENIYNHALTCTPGILKDDLLRCAWMLAVGATDAYFCDAFGDILARTLRAKQIEPTIELKDKIKNIKIPASSVIRISPSDGWKWRMVARDVIEKENILSIKKIKDIFNHFLSNNRGFIKQSSKSFDEWILHKESKFRMFGVYKSEYRNSTSTQRTNYKKKALDKFLSHYSEIFQRRHDCIHNCDRPKIKIQTNKIRDNYVNKVIYDLKFLVKRCNEELIVEFPKYLRRCGFSSSTRNSVC